MTEFNTFNGFCIAVCMFMIFFGMATSVISAVAPNVFPGLSTIDTANAEGEISSGYLDFGGMIGLYAGAIAVVTLLAIVTGSTNLIGVWLFGAVFWASFSSLSLTLNNLLFSYMGATGVLIIGILWIGMIMMFIGAIIGMLSGSQSMR